MNNQDIVDVGNLVSSMIPEEGETISVKGGRGNRTLRQKKKENGMFYIRDNESCEWEECPDLVWNYYLKMKKMFNI